MTVTLSEKIRGIFIIGFYEHADVYFEAQGIENDYNYDDIGVVLDIEKLKKQKSELIKSLSLWYTAFRI